MVEINKSISIYPDKIKKQIVREAAEAGLLPKESKDNSDIKNSLRKNEQEKDEKYIESAKKRLEGLEKIVDFGAHGMIYDSPDDKWEFTENSLLYIIALERIGKNQEAEKVLENTLKNVGFGEHRMICRSHIDESEYTWDSLLHIIALERIGKKQEAKEVMENTLKHVGFGAHGMICRWPDDESEYTSDTLLLLIAESIIEKKI